MDPVVPYIVLIAAGGAWHYYFYKESGGRTHRPLWMAFSATALSIIFLAAGTTGFLLSPHDRFVSHTSWTGSIVWWELEAGLGLAILAAFLWRLGLRDLKTDAARGITRS